MADFVPDRDGDFTAWAQQFTGALLPVGGSLGFSPAEQADLQSDLAAWENAYAEWVDKQNAAKGATATKRNVRHELEQRIRRFARRIHAHPAATSELRAGLGLKVGERRVSKLPAPLVAPKLELDFGTRGACLIHFGENPWNERLNRMAENAAMVILEFRTSRDADWKYLACASDSPFVHILESGSPVGVEYRAHYLSPSKAPGPMSAAHSAVIQAAA